MSAILQRFHQTANNALVNLSEHCPPGSKLTLVICTPGKPEMDIVFEDKGLDTNEVLSALRRRGLSIDGDNAYKRDLCSSIIGSMAFGNQDRCPPPPGHWAQTFWDIGRAEGAQKEELIQALDMVTDCLTKALTGGEVSAVRAGRALTNAAEVIAKATGTTVTTAAEVSPCPK